MSSQEFCSWLHTFFGQLPKEFQYAGEIRNTGSPGPVHRQVLERHGVAHVYNHWSYMPSLADQHQCMEAFTAPFTVPASAHTIEDILRSGEETSGTVQQDRR